MLSGPDHRRRPALAVAFVAVTLALGIAIWATVTAIRGSNPQSPWRWDRIHELEAASFVWAALVCLLAWAWWRREPWLDGRVRRLPPIGLLAAMAVLAAAELTLGDPSTRLSAMVLGGIFAAAAWVADAVWFSGSGSALVPVDPVAHLGGASGGGQVADAGGAATESDGGSGDSSAGSSGSVGPWDIDRWRVAEQVFVVLLAVAVPLVAVGYARAHPPQRAGDGWPWLVVALGATVTATSVILAYGLVRSRWSRPPGSPSAARSWSSAGRGHAAWSVLRAGVLAASAAITAAGLYAAFVIATDSEYGLVAAGLGAAVGLAVTFGRARLTVSGVRTLSVLLTAMSLAASYYLIVQWLSFESSWEYDGDGVTPELVPVGEAARIAWSIVVENPGELLFWGLALATASGTARPVGARTRDREGTGADLAVSPPPDLANEPRPVVQMVTVEPRRLRAADLELVAVIPHAGGPFRVRHLSCAASDLPAALPHLLEPDPTRLAHAGAPAHPRTVVDEDHDTADQAMEAAEGQGDAWVDAGQFCSSVQREPEFVALLRPGAQRVGLLGRVVVLVICVAAVVSLMVGGYRLSALAGPDLSTWEEPVGASVLVVVLYTIAIATGLVLTSTVFRLIASRNLAKATARQEPGSAAAVAPRPHAHLVERPRIRWLWFGLVALPGAAVVVVGVLATQSDDGGAVRMALVGLGMLLIAMGLLFLRVSIVADGSGLVVTTVVRRRAISWSDLEDIVFLKVQAEIDLGLYQLRFLTRTGRPVTSAATGRLSPGSPLARLQEDLLAMKDRYAPRP